MSPLFAFVLACVDPGPKPGDSGSATEDTGTPDSTTTPSPYDADGDGYRLGDDCDDGDAATHPGATDVPDDGVDQDCDGIDACVVDRWYKGVIDIHSDGDLAEFGDFCLEYDGIEGSLFVAGISAADLSAFSCVCELQWFGTAEVVIYENPGLESLAGLEHLTRADGWWEIRDNPLLSDISALSRLTTLDDVFVLQDLPSLDSLAPLANVTEWGEYVSVSWIPLGNLTGMEGMREVGRLGLGTLPLTTLEALAGLEVVTDALDLASFTSEAGPTNLEGLDALREVGWLHASSLEALETLGPLPSLTTAAVSVARNDTLTHLSLPPSLTRLLGLSATGPALVSVSTTLASGHVEGDVVLYDSPLLTDLTGLAPVTAVDGDLTVTDNVTLASLEGLMNIRSVGGSLTITGNTSLPRAEAEALVDAIGLANIGGYVTVRDNGP